MSSKDETNVSNDNENVKITVDLFDGDRKKYRAFMNLIALFFSFKPNWTDAKKVSYVLALMTKGEAELW